MLRNIIHRSPFLIKLLNWEYWPTYVVYFPLSFYYLFLAARARSFFFFSASNPSIETGGMFFESKWKIFEIIPKEYFPKTILIPETDSPQQAIAAVAKSRLQYPLIAKPDRGERGWAVQKIDHEAQLINYALHNKIDFLVQEYVDYPIEMSVFYYRSPMEEKGIVSSVTFKELLSVHGNGKDSLRKLIMQQPRALLQLRALEQLFTHKMDEVLAPNEKKLLVPYGNHCRGAMFLDYNHIIDEQLNSTFDVISKRIPGFYYGRYDIKCKSIEDLKAGRNFSIVELNGAGAEPAHIYQPNYSFFKAQKEIFKHYSKLCDISIQNANMGIPYISFRDFRAMQLDQKNYRNKVKMQ